MPKVLVIDDSRSCLEAIETMFSGAGYLVTTSTDGKRAVHMMQHEAFDLILTDLYMPGEDGIEVIRDARKLHPGLPLVAMSGATGVRNLLAVARHLGACQILQKPFSRDELLQVVEAALNPVPPGHSASSDERGAIISVATPAGDGSSTIPSLPVEGTHQ